MSGAPLKFESPIQDAISRLRFIPTSHNLLISSWDSKLRLYDVESSLLRLEAPAEAALLDCCFQNETVAFSAGSDGSVRRYDLHSGNCETIGNHDDLATCIGYSDETSLVITAGLDKKLYAWDSRMEKSERSVFVKSLDLEVTSMSLVGLNMMVTMGASIHMCDLRNLQQPFESKDSDLNTTIICSSASLYAKGFAVGSADGRVSLEICHSSNSDNIRYMFRCHPKSTDRRYHLAAVNEIVFNPITYGAFLTGDDEGHVIAWDATTRKRLFQLPRCPNSVASLSYHHQGRLLAVASSYTYRKAIEIEELPQIFIHEADDANLRSADIGSSSRWIGVLELHCCRCHIHLSIVITPLSLSPPRITPSPTLLSDHQNPYPSLSLSRSSSAMSDEEHHFESKADAGASKTYPQQAGTIRKNGYIVIKNRPCKVVEVSTSKTGKHGHAKCHFVGIDIFTAKKLEDIVPSSHNCDVPHVNRTDYQLIDISEDGFVSLLTENGNTKDDLRLPTDDSLLTQIKDGFAEGKDLVVSVMSAMGEEQICALKDIGPK
ncbi:mitotic checkpoint protein BUB3.3-like [Argentina anserina]|uniref:mitotic checkpoint protein BUB3.3-like n=1 Tax=Argentina anserina TaxID=57926 RepID=UPI0021766660|nr:mitotic checkpoint protein BUB3.3-like [Potentilla anserina]